MLAKLKLPAAALTSGLLLVLIFPRFGLTWLAPVALAPLLWMAACEASWKRRLLYGWAAGFLQWGCTCYWIRGTLENYGGTGVALSWVALFLFAAAKGAHMAGFTALAGPLMKSPVALPAAAALWTGLERTHAPLGFTWLLLGNAGADMPLPMRLAPVLGVYGLSFLFAMTSAAVALAVLGRPRRQLAPVLACFLLFLLPPLPTAKPARQNAVTVQPDIDDDSLWTRERAHREPLELGGLTVGEATRETLPQPAFLLWPEVPAPFYYGRDLHFTNLVADVAKTARAPFIFGTVAFTSDLEPLNSAQMVDAAGRAAGRYDKIYLVPFGEFVPPLFGWINKISSEAGDFVPGREVTVFALGGHRLGLFICYESAFPHLVRRFVRNGAEVLANLSNDGYFGNSAAREQHLLLVRMRSAENGRWILRATNDGITAAIDPAGRVVSAFPPFRRHAGRLPFDWETVETPYVRHGDWFAWLCLVAAVSGALLPLARLARRRQAGGSANPGAR